MRLLACFDHRAASIFLQSGAVMRSKLLWAIGVTLAGAVAFSASQSEASTITYSVNDAVGVGSVVGFIETEGSLGPLSSVNIIDWNLQLNYLSNTFTLQG